MSNNNRSLAAIRHALATASALAVLSSMQAQAAPPTIVRSDITAATSAVPVPNPGSCQVFINASVGVFERGRQDPFEPGPGAFFNAFGENTCTGTPFSSFGFSRDITFTKVGQSVRASGTIAVFSFNISTFETTVESVTFSLDARAFSLKTVRRWGQENFENAGARMSNSFDDNTRAATVTGTFIGVMFGAPLNATADPMTTVSDSKSRTIFFEFKK